MTLPLQRSTCTCLYEIVSTTALRTATLSRHTTLASGTLIPDQLTDAAYPSPTVYRGTAPRGRQVPDGTGAPCHGTAAPRYTAVPEYGCRRCRVPGERRPPRHLPDTRCESDGHLSATVCPSTRRRPLYTFSPCQPVPSLLGGEARRRRRGARSRGASASTSAAARPRQPTKYGRGDGRRRWRHCGARPAAAAAAAARP